MEDIKAQLIKALLQTITYDDMTKEQEELVIEYEMELYKPKVDELKAALTKEEIEQRIHEWWLDYQIADGTEDNLIRYINGGF